MKKNLTIILMLVIAVFARAQDTTRLSLLFLGDIMQHDSQISDAWDPAMNKYNYGPCFQFVKPYTQGVDLAIGNLELTLAGPPYRGYPQFSAPDQLAVALKEMGMDVLVTANNHCVDTGKKGLERTIEMLDSLDIPHTGTFSDEASKLNDHPLLIRKNGFTLALLNYTFSTNGLPVASPNIVNRIDTTAIRKDIEKAKTLLPDMIIVFYHWGNEYESFPSSWQKTVTEFSFRKGAQMVIGAHPHVIQPMEWRKDHNQLVVYSLGNFVSGQRKRYTDGGAMIRIELEKISNGEVSSTKIDTANYILQWVYRTTDAEKNYFVLPVPKFESAGNAFINDNGSREAFKTFVNDSRELLEKNNLLISELKNIPSDTLITYSVLYYTHNTNIQDDKILPAVPYEIFTKVNTDGNTEYYSGVFSDPREAEKYKRKIVEKLGYKEAVVVRNAHP